MRGLQAAARRLLASPPSASGAVARGYSTELPDNLLPVVAIIGRPNVGKSALFNRLVRRREAVVHDTPGGHVTRDYQEGLACLADLRFKVVDTSGLEPFLPGATIQARATALTAKVLHRSDVALFLIDGSTGPLPADAQLASWLRKTVLRPGGGSPTPAPSGGGRGCAVVLAANKCERRGSGAEGSVTAALAESQRLGLGEPVALSAMTGEGMTDLYQALQPLLDPLVAARLEAVRQLEAPLDNGEDAAASVGGGVAAEAEAEAEAGPGQQDVQQAVQQQQQVAGGSGPLRIAIMGLPNVGKSTLANRLLQEERCLTGPEPGLTRDAIKQRLSWRGREVELVDTAGWIRRTKLAAYDESGGAVAEQTVAEARSVMQFVHAVALVVDAARALELGEGLTHREVTLASDVVREGRLLLLVANKLDALAPAQRERAMQLVRKVAEQALPDVSGVPILGLSALTGQGAEALLPAAVTMYDRWNQRVSTARLNRWVAQKSAQYQSGGGKELNRITYMSQVKARPPTFVTWISGSSPLSTASQRFVAGQIRRQFGFDGVPLRITVRHKKPRAQRGRRQ